VLYDYLADEVKDGSNLMRLDNEGHLIWKAKPPGGNLDYFTGVKWDGRVITANTWCCYIVSLDLENGEVTVLAFTK